MRKRWSQLGFIRAVEVTKGINSWQPHFHIVLFFSAPVFWPDVQNDFFDRWASIAKKEFGWILPRASLDLRGHSNAATYINKWPLEDEITLAHIKRGRGENLTPFELLASYVNGDKASGEAWLEFSAGVSHFNGERVESIARLTWSKGLKKLLGIAELTDDQIVDLQDKRARLLGVLTYDQWLKVLAQDYAVRPVLLTLATQGNFEDVVNFVNKLPDRAKGT